MKRVPAMFFLVVFCSMLAFITCKNESPVRENKLGFFFPTAQHFVVKTPKLSTDNVASIENALGKHLHPDDLTPTFHIATTNARRPLGTVLFLEMDMLSGGVGLNMQGKIVQVDIHELNLGNSEFLDQFAGKGVEDAFEVGSDVRPIPGQEEISQAVAHLAQKALLMTYALFSKNALAVPVCTAKDKRYVISQLTKNVLKRLNGVVTINVYYSREPTQVAERRRKIRGVLDEYRAFSNKLQINFINPVGFDDGEKQELRSRRITELQENIIQADNDDIANVYMSVAIAYGAKEEVFPVVEDTNTIEYDLTSAILKVTAEGVGKSLLEVVEPETLMELMDMMKKEYDILRGYFQTGKTRCAALNAAKQLVGYIAFIDYFEPPSNPNQREEYTYIQEQVSTALYHLIDAVEVGGLSDNSRNRWEQILNWVNKAHLRFSIDEVDLDDDLD